MTKYIFIPFLTSPFGFCIVPENMVSEAHRKINAQCAREELNVCETNFDSNFFKGILLLLFPLQMLSI